MDPSPIPSQPGREERGKIHSLCKCRTEIALPGLGGLGCQSQAVSRESWEQMAPEEVTVLGHPAVPNTCSFLARKSLPSEHQFSLFLNQGLFASSEASAELPEAAPVGGVFKQRVPDPSQASATAGGANFSIFLAANWDVVHAHLLPPAPCPLPTLYACFILQPSPDHKACSQ